MTYHDPDERAERIEGVVHRYRAGEFSEVVFTASLKALGLGSDSIESFVRGNRHFYVQSLPFKRGDVK